MCSTMPANLKNSRTIAPTVPIRHQGRSGALAGLNGLIDGLYQYL
jgi:hypothetical protein